MPHFNKKKYRKSVFFFDKMEFKQIITATVAVILIILVAIPIINDGVYDIEKVSQTNPTGYYEMMDQNDDVSVSFNNLSNKITINGQEITADGYGVVVLSDQAIIGIIPQASSYWQYVTTTFANKIDISSSSPTTYQCTLEASGGTMTCKITKTDTSGTTVRDEATLEYTYLFIPTTSTDSSDIYCQYGNMTSTTARVNAGTDMFLYKMGGVFSDTYQLTKIKAGSTTATMNKYALTNSGSTQTPVTGPTEASLTLSWSEIDDTDSYKLVSSVTSGESQTAVTSALVPKDYYIIKENTTSSIIKLVPVLLISALLIGIASSMIIRRD